MVKLRVKYVTTEHRIRVVFLNLVQFYHQFLFNFIRSNSPKKLEQKAITFQASASSLSFKRLWSGKNGFQYAERL